MSQKYGIPELMLPDNLVACNSCFKTRGKGLNSTTHMDSGQYLATEVSVCPEIL